jgi:hypothetical protein
MCPTTTPTLSEKWIRGEFHEGSPLKRPMGDCLHHNCMRGFIFMPRFPQQRVHSPVPLQVSVHSQSTGRHHDSHTFNCSHPFHRRYNQHDILRYIHDASITTQIRRNWPPKCQFLRKFRQQVELTMLRRHRDADVRSVDTG